MKYILKNKEIELTAEEVAEIVKQNQAPAEEKKIVINTIFGGIKFQSTKTTLREAILEKYSSDADLSGANLRGADLSDADLSDAELMSAKFYGRGGNKPLKRSQLPDFLGALGFIIEE